MKFDTNRRVLLLFCLFIVFIIVIFCAYGYYNIFEREDLMKEATKYTMIKKTVEAQRGSIYSHDGNLMSTNMPLYKLYMDTRVEYLSDCGTDSVINIYIDSLSYCLSKKFKDRTPKEYKKYILDGFHKGNRALPLYPRYVSYFDYQEVSKFPLFRLGKYKGGLKAEDGSMRQHMYGNLCASTIGNIYKSTGNGRSGLEYVFNDYLKGKDGYADIIKFGNYMLKRPVIEPVDGCDVYTTIDIDIQDICESELKNTLSLYGGERGCMVLMEVKTGKIRAIVDLARAEKGVYVEAFDEQNMAISDLSTPGSTFKTMSLMIALEDNVCDTNDIVSTGKGIYYFNGIPIKDSNWKKGGHGDISVYNVLVQSSNIGVMKIINDAYRKKPEKFINRIVDSKFTQDIEISLPNANTPILPDPESPKWSAISLPWLSMGYEVRVPPIYTLNFYNAIANNGVMVRPYIVEKVVSADEEEVLSFDTKITNSSICSYSTLRKLQSMLRGVVESDSGTARMINSEKLKIAGKTGTAQMPGGGEQITFCGYFPFDNPLYSAIVVVKRPYFNIGAGNICGRTFYLAAKKIFAMHLKEDIDSYEQLPDSVNIPPVKAGNASKVSAALKKLDYRVKGSKANWVSTSFVDGTFVPKEVEIIDGLVPNVYGMAAVDALYLLEKSGLRVMLYGSGRVVSQSISPGVKVKKGETIHITLQNR